MSNLKKPPAQPVVKWVGGKRQLQHKIVPNFTKLLTDSNTYFEPFLGGGAIFFGLQPQKAVLSDINSGLINLYECLRDQLQVFLRKKSELESSYNKLDVQEQAEFYYRIRGEYNRTERQGIEQAINFLFLNKAGFNGIYRENKQGGFNVPFGHKTKISLGENELLASASDRFSNVELLNESFAEVVNKVSPGDLVYFDPPYVPLSATSAFTSYSADGFGLNEQLQLREVFDQLDQAGVYVAMSNSSAPLIRDELYKGFQFTELEASRNVSARSSGRAPVTELIVSNFEFC